MSRMPLLAAVGAAVVVLLLQAVPSGRDHANPPTLAEPPWDSPRTRELARRACFDCHSNQTVWPWYSEIAPVSWSIQREVEAGRAKLNFSEWGAGRGASDERRSGRRERGEGQEEAGESAEAVVEGEMPPPRYVLLHPEARLSATERQALVRGLEATFGERR